MRRDILIFIALILLSCSPISKYRHDPNVLSWENDIKKFEQLDKSEDYDKDAILFAGSSSIRLWSSLEKDMSPYHIIQRGYGGAKLSDFAVYTRRIIDQHPCQAIVLFVANDITGSPQDKKPEEVASLFSYILKTIRKSHPSTPVFWIEITPTSSRWKVWTQIQDVNARIKSICEKSKNTYFITTASAFLNDKGVPNDDLFRDDKLHLNEKGYAIWSEIIRKELALVLGK